MELRVIGAICIVIACSAFGAALIASYKREVQSLRQLINMLDFMECELQYRLTPLPQLVCETAREAKGVLRMVFVQFARELEDQVSPDVSCCMQSAVGAQNDIPPITAECLIALGSSLGRFDLQGQLNGLDGIRQMCRSKLSRLEHNKDARLRTYQTLCVCAGAALAILLI